MGDKSMRAAVYYKSQGLVVEDTAMPSMGPDEVLVKVSNTGFCGSDHSIIESGDIPDGIILGHEVSGTVVEAGKDVKDVRTGMKVIIRPTYCGACRDCRMGKPYFCQVNRRLIGMGDLQGAFAEYIKVFPQMLIPVPHGVDSRNAALAEAYAASLHGIKCSGKDGGPALVMGGGPIGLALVKLLRLKGFGPIAVTEPVKEKRDLAAAFGADLVIDPFHENTGMHVFECTDGVGFETVFECSGATENVQAAIDFAARGGVVCVVSVILKQVSIMPAAMTFKEILLTASYGNTHEENGLCLEWMAEGKLDGRELISDLISLEQLPDVYKERIHTGKAIKVMLQ
ncbi:MAG: alcohol dehydrogenase catalytic domain-containing protein, partial [Deltaproteobacteria bacterium]|nr:alcohol dehydrogenase catalytic domain-containing protein [Deltaproteobacteria bacterium]